MFNRHQAKIGKWARECPENMIDVATLAILSAHQPFVKMPIQMDAVKEHADSAIPLFSWKRKAYQWWLYHGASVYTRLMHAWAYETLGDFADIALFEAVQAPGFGFVKAGFFIQMAFGVSGCLDTHNCKLYGIPAKLVRSRPKYAYTHACQYNDRVIALGGSEFLWNTWCEHVHKRHPAWFGSAEQVSATHCVALGLEP